MFQIMRSILPFLSFALFPLTVSAACQSYGIDFVDGGNYFIDVTSLDQFSFLTQFEGKPTIHTERK